MQIPADKLIKSVHLQSADREEFAFYLKFKIGGDSNSALGGTIFNYFTEPYM